MNRSELVRIVAERAGSDESVARRHVDAVFDTVMERVSAGERVTVTGFGTFDSLARPARSARNPRTGLPVEVPAGQVPRFRSGQTFRNRVAGSAPAAAVEAAGGPAPEAVVAAPVEAPAPKKTGKKDGKKAGKNAGGKKGSGRKASGQKASDRDAAAVPAAKAAKNGKKDAGKNGKAGKDAKGPKNGKKKAGKAKARAKAAG